MMNAQKDWSDCAALNSAIVLTVEATSHKTTKDLILINPFTARDEYILSSLDTLPAHNDKYLSSQETLCAHTIKNPLQSKG